MIKIICDRCGTDITDAKEHTIRFDSFIYGSMATVCEKCYKEINSFAFGKVSDEEGKNNERR